MNGYLLNIYCDSIGLYYPFDMFMQMFLQDHIIDMVRLTSLNLFDEAGNKNDHNIPVKGLNVLLYCLRQPVNSFEPMIHCEIQIQEMSTPNTLVFSTLEWSGIYFYLI